MKVKVGIIGTGNMGGAIAKALEKDGSYAVSVYNRTFEKAEKLAQGTTIKAVEDMNELSHSDVVILAVKPQVLPSVYDGARKLEGGMYISLAAGVTLETLKKELNSNNVVRYMPNIAASVKASVTAFTYPEDMAGEKKKLAEDIASSFGSAFHLDESLFNAFIGISGSGIAYVYEFIHALSQAGVREGINYNMAQNIVLGTIESAITLQKASGKGAIELENMVCSPKGTTIEGIKKLKELNFENALFEATSASASKAGSIEAANGSGRKI